MAVSPSLIQWCSGELSTLLVSETSDEFIRYLLEISDDGELKDYLSQLLDPGDPKAAAFVEELLNRRKDADGPALPQNFTVYRKASAQDEVGVRDGSRHKGKSKNKEKKSASQDAPNPPSHKSNATNPPPGYKSYPPLTSIPTQPQVQPETQQYHPVQNGFPTEDEQMLALQQGARRKTKFVPLYSQEGQARSAIHLPGRHPCSCQAAKHALVSNCLECGRVVCSQEGSGPCLFCGALVCNKEEQEILARHSKKSEKLRKKLMGEGQAPAKESTIDRAIAHKNTLIEYDKTSVRRTQVVDDQSDYFSSDTNRWLSDRDKTELKAREDHLREQRHGSRLNKKFTLDFAGRTVTEEVNKVEMYNRTDDVVQRVTFGNKPGEGRLQAQGSDTTILNPGITREAPKFVSETRTSGSQKTNHRETEQEPSSRSNPRVQDRELLEMSDDGFCLSMHQPWASLLVAGIKKHEGRTWYSPHRGRLWIAAAAKVASEEEIDAAQAPYTHMYEGVTFPEHYPTGCLLGCVDMMECLAQDEYRIQYPDGESSSPFVFICANPQELFIKFPVKGRHKIWKLEGQMHKSAKQGLRQILQRS